MKVNQNDIQERLVTLLKAQVADAEAQLEWLRDSLKLATRGPVAKTQGEPSAPSKKPVAKKRRTIPLPPGVTRTKVLQVMAGGGVISRNFVAEKINMTPGAITHHLRALRAEGVIERVSSGHYRLIQKPVAPHEVVVTPPLNALHSENTDYQESIFL